MRRVGLTGGIGSGKSEVARRLAAAGATVIDSDLLARDVVAPGTDGAAAVIAAFGPGIAPGGVLDRAALGRVVFADSAARRRLEAIVHPLVRARARELEATARTSNPDGVVVHDIPLLVETGQADAFDVVVVVDVDPAVQLDRLVRLRGLTFEDAAARIAAQATREARLAAADEVLDNNGSLDSLAAQVDALWGRLSVPRVIT